MRKAFTLIELMIVVAVMAILMGLVFRLSSLGTDSHRRTVTIMRLQKLENCLSGYNAAFGSYPPVKLHGTRDIYATVSNHGIQEDNTNENIWNWNEIGEHNENLAWDQVRAACKAQPVVCRFPFPDGYDKYVENISREMKRRAESNEEHFKGYSSNPNRKMRLSAGYDDGVSRDLDRHASSKDKTDWRDIQLFKFGLLSYLLPRYLVMMNGPYQLFDNYAQWTGNNVLPSDPFTGNKFSNWRVLREQANNIEAVTDIARVSNIPSQSVCARWMPNLAGICRANRHLTLFGIDITDSTAGYDLDVDNYNIEIFPPSGSDSYSGQYILDGISVVDGWGQEFYYYSPPPFQRYTLWSAGPNGRTFPPWVDRTTLNSKGNKCVGKWVVDDIIHLSN